MGQQLSILTKALMAACAILLFWLIWVMNDFDKLQVKFDNSKVQLGQESNTGN